MHTRRCAASGVRGRPLGPTLECSDRASMRGSRARTRKMSEVSFHEYLIGQALAGLLASGLALEEAATRAVEAANLVIAKLEAAEQIKSARFQGTEERRHPD